MSPSQIIVLATPVFFLLIALELAIGFKRQRNTYRLADAVSSISLGMLSQTSAVFTRLLRIGIYTALFEHVALWRNDAFWTSLPGWLLALVFYDFCYYWLHRMGHESAVLWAAHAVHHQSQDYNLSTALRQTSSGALLGWIFYVPMALAGVPPLVFGVVALIDLLYQFWVHTEQVGRLGWFDRWFCSPSNHRVHHAVNDAYLDKNYGGILILWDRMFGTFKDEDLQEKCVRHPRLAQQLGPAVGQRAGVRRTGARQLARAQLARQAQGLDQAARLAAGGCGGAAPEARIQHGTDAAVPPTHVACRAVVCAGAVCAAAHRRGSLFVAGRCGAVGAQRYLVCRAADGAMVPRRGDAGAHRHADGADAAKRGTGHGHQCAGAYGVALAVQATDHGNRYYFDSYQQIFD